MPYSTALSPSTINGYSTQKASGAGGCSCTSAALEAVESTPGLGKISNPFLYPLVIDQGTAFTQKIALTRGTLTDMANSMTAGPNGKLIFPTSQEMCFKVGDSVRVLNYDQCKPDVDDVYVVSAVSNTDAEKSVTLTGFNPPVGKTFRATSSNTSEVLLGCIGISQVAASSSGPRIIQHITANPKMLASGGATARQDYSSSHGIEFASGNAWCMSRVLDTVKPGDSLVSVDAGIPNPVKVLEVRKVGTSDGGMVERIRLAVPPTSSGCFLAHIRRGRLFSFRSTYSSNGTLELRLPASATAGLQLLDSWMVEADDDASGIFEVGSYSVALHWSELVSSQLINKSRIILRGPVFLRASHIFDNGY